MLNKGVQQRTICWEHEGNRAIRIGKWKLVSEYPGTWSTVRKYENKGNWELYDMESDRTEQNDLSKQFPEKVKELEMEWKAWADKVGVVPWETFEGGDY